MKTLVSALAVVAVSGLLPCSSRAGEPGTALLAAHRNKHRVLLVFAPAETDSVYQAQTRLWRGEDAGFADRDLVVVPVFHGTQPGVGGDAATLTARYHPDRQSFEVVLIGKDGQEAYRSDRPVAAGFLYHRIDAMPMRRDEVRRKKTQE